MTKEQSIYLLVQVARMAQKAGLLTLEDANAALVATYTVAPKEEKKEEKKK